MHMQLALAWQEGIAPGASVLRLDAGNAARLLLAGRRVKAVRCWAMPHDTPSSSGARQRDRQPAMHARLDMKEATSEAVSGS
jgi:hypothetical protein